MRGVHRDDRSVVEPKGVINGPLVDPVKMVTLHWRAGRRPPYVETLFTGSIEPKVVICVDIPGGHPHRGRVRPPAQPSICEWTSAVLRGPVNPGFW
jgi:hypothetical protein